MIIRVQAVVKDIQGKTLTLATDDQQEIRVAAGEVGDSLQIGEQCMITVQPLSEALLDQSSLARSILNTLITHEQSEEESGDGAATSSEEV